jgi:hypothetical protein
MFLTFFIIRHCFVWVWGKKVLIGMKEDNANGYDIFPLRTRSYLNGHADPLFDISWDIAGA